MVRKKWFSCIVFVLMMTMLLTACGSNGETDAANDNDVAKT